MTQEDKKNRKCIPVVDCPNCGAIDVPLSFHGRYRKEGLPIITVWSCTKCGTVPNLDEDLKVKRYISANDLEKMGFSRATDEELANHIEKV